MTPLLRSRKGEHEQAYRTQLRALNVLPDDVLAHLATYHKNFLTSQTPTAAPPTP